MTPEELFQNSLQLAFPNEIAGDTGPPKKPLIQHRLEAMSLAQRAFVLHRGASAARLCGRIARALNRHELAECYFRAFFDLSGAAPDASFHLGQVLIEMGHTQQGLEFLDRGFAREPGQMEGAWRWARLQAIPSDSDWEHELAIIDQLLSTGSGNRRDQTHLSFCRAFLLDRLDRIDEAMTEFTVAIQRKPRPADENALAAFERYPLKLNNFNTDQAERNEGQWRGTRPIFIVGMPRSGTTLIERLLVEATGAFTAGELLDLDAIAQILTSDETDKDAISAAQVLREHRRSLTLLSEGSDAVIDKMPTNFLYLDRIAEWFPDAIIIHCRRSEQAVRWSCFTSNLAWPFCDLQACQKYQQAYAERMNRLRESTLVQWLDVDYEKTVQSPDQTRKTLAEFCDAKGLALQPSSANAYATRTINKVSVHQPVHTKSIERWKRYLEK